MAKSTKKIILDPKRLEEVCEASRDNDEVAKTLGISKSSVTRLCRRHKVKPPYQRKNRQRDIEPRIDDLHDFYFNRTTSNQPQRKLTESEKFGQRLWTIATQPPVEKLTVEEYNARKKKEAKEQKKAISHKQGTGKQYVKSLQKKKPEVEDIAPYQR